MTDACEKLIKQCLEFDASKGNEEPSGRLRPEIVEEVGERYATIILTAVGQVQKEHAANIRAATEQLREIVQKMVEVYAKTFRVNFSFAPTEEVSGERMQEVSGL